MKKILITIALVGVSVGVGSIFVSLFDNNQIENLSASVASSAGYEVYIDSSDYRQELQAIVSDYQLNPTSAQAGTAHALLLGLRVPGEYRDLHLDLVVYFDKQQHAPRPDYAQLQAILAEVTWLSF